MIPCPMVCSRHRQPYDGIERTELGEVMGITHLPFVEWFERFGPPASAAYVEAHPYAGQRDDAASDVPPT
jgi:hypothetical protein